MEFKYYQRKNTGIAEHELDWINENLYSIHSKESVFFAFQAEYETLLIASKHIYFPNRQTLIKLDFNTIRKVKIAGDVLLELITNDKKVYSIVFTDVISKVKIHEVLNLLIKNSKENTKTTLTI